MIRGIVATSLHRPLFVVLAVLVFIGGGLIAFKNLPVEAFPDVTDTQVTVITLFPGRAAEEVERQVTIPLEVALAGIPNAVRLFSHTQFGLSFMVITFNDKATDYFARQQVTERLRNAELPEGVQPELAALTSAISEIYRYRVRSDALDSTELRTLQNWIMERQLKTVPGVADVVKPSRTDQDLRGPARHPEDARLQDLARAARAGPRQVELQRRRRLRRARPPAVPDPRHRAAAQRRRPRERAGDRAQRLADPRATSRA